MAFPTVVSRTPTVSATSNSTSFAVTLPAAVAIGDYLIAIVSSDGNPTLSTTSTDWNKVGQASNGTTVTGAVFYRKYTSTTVGSLTINSTASEQYSSIVLRVSGVDGLLSANANGSSTNSDPPNLPISVTRDYQFIVSRSGDAQVVATVAPTNYTQLQTQAGGGTGGASTNTAEYQLNTGTDHNPGTFTSNTEQWVTWTLGLYGVSPSISPAQGSATVTGYAPTFSVVNPNPSISPGAGTATVTGLAPLLAVAIAIGAGAVTFSSEPFAPKIEAANNYGGGGPGLLLSLANNLTPRIEIGVGASTFTGYAPELGLSYTIDIQNATATISGSAPSLSVNQTAFSIETGLGSLSIDGQIPSAFLGLGVLPGVGSLAFAGETPTVEVNSYGDTGGGYGGLLLALNTNFLGTRVSYPDVGSITIEGYAPDLILFGSVYPGVGSVSITGYAPTLVRTSGARAYGPLMVFGLNLDPETAGGFLFNLPVGEATISGLAPTVTRGGEYVLGWDDLVAGYATFEGDVDRVVTGGNTISSPGNGSVTITGYAPAVINTLRAEPFSGVVVILGRAPIMDATFQTDVGSITFTGHEPTLTITQPIVAPGVGTLTLTGLQPSLYFGYQSTSGNLIARRAFFAIYEVIPGSGEFYALPASTRADIVRTVTGSGTLVAQRATLETFGWECQQTVDEDWSCQDGQTETWTDLTDTTEVWTNV